MTINYCGSDFDILLLAGGRGGGEGANRLDVLPRVRIGDERHGVGWRFPADCGVERGVV